jgi:hypothetical protein
LRVRLQIGLSHPHPVNPEQWLDEVNTSTRLRRKFHYTLKVTQQKLRQRNQIQWNDVIWMLEEILDWPTALTLSIIWEERTIKKCKSLG